MYYYISTVNVIISLDDIAARHSLMRELGVRYSGKELWVKYLGYVGVYCSSKELSQVEQEVLQLRALSDNEKDLLSYFKS